MDEYSFEAKQADLEKLLVELSASSSVCEDEKERIRIEKQFTNIYNP